MTRDELRAELDAAVEATAHDDLFADATSEPVPHEWLAQLATYTVREDSDWVMYPNDDSADVSTVEAAADHLKDMGV